MGDTDQLLDHSEKLANNQGDKKLREATKILLLKVMKKFGGFTPESQEIMEMTMPSWFKDLMRETNWLGLIDQKVVQLRQHRTGTLIKPEADRLKA
ncbi:hypothetical protein HYZ76_01840 [Candidatus Falkowbacteria bacterium]|nr:hypothetical protein [Candidatus Falkowbacteria bacterium]